MKKLMSGLLKLSVYASFMVFTFSCQPKDENLRPVTPSASKSMSPKEKNQMLALTFDRIAEAVHLLKTTVDADYSAQYNIEIVNTQNSELVSIQNISGRVDISDIVIKSKAKVVDTKSNEPTSKTAHINLSLKRLLTNDDGILEQFFVTKESSDEIKNTGYRYENKKPLDFSAITQSESVSINKTATGLYNVIVSRVDDTSSRKDRNSFIMTKIGFELNWSGKLNELGDVIKIKLLDMSVERKGEKIGALKVKALTSDSNSLNLNLAACASLGGSVQLSFAQPNIEGKPAPDMVRTIQIKDSTIRIDEDDFSSEAAECKNRPVVDLSRML
jgi:hypothetical protein